MTVTNFLWLCGLVPGPHLGIIPLPNTRRRSITMPDYMPRNEFELLAWLQTFNSVAAANLSALGLVAGDLTPCTTATAAFATSLPASAAARDASKSATAAKDSDMSLAVSNA